MTQFWKSLLDISQCNYSHIYPSVPFVGLLSSIGSPNLSYKLNTHLLTFMMRKIHIITVDSPQILQNPISHGQRKSIISTINPQVWLSQVFKSHIKNLQSHFTTGHAEACWCLGCCGCRLPLLPVEVCSGTWRGELTTASRWENEEKTHETVTVV